MTAIPEDNGDLFYGTLVAVVLIAPFLLLFAAGGMPEGIERGELIVYGHGVVLAGAASAMVLRAAYAHGFRKALKIAALERNYSVTA